LINEHRERTEEVKSESQREPFTSLVVDRKISKSKKPLVIKQETRYNQDIKSKKNHMGAFYPFVSESNLTLSQAGTNVAKTGGSC
jgi:hypothetical protein